MFKTKIMALITLGAFVISMLAIPVSAQADLTAIGKLSVVEKAIYGVPQTGALLDRTVKLEQDVYGQETHDAILPRVDKIYSYLFETTEQNPAIVTKLNAVEWTFSHAVSHSPIKARVEELEKTLNGTPVSGSLSGRIDKLLHIAYSGGQFEVASTAIPADTLVKIKTLSTLNNKQSRPGDAVALAVAEDVYVGGVLVLPKGAKGFGKVTKVQQPKSFGRDAKLEISFDSLVAIDGTTINTFLGDKAKEETKSLAKAAGASVAGMVILGPVGIIGGAFVNGKEANIPIGSQLYVQTKDEIEVFGIKTK
ncbi:hypothetical protein [Sporomusa aerivorans]|uniref:hypothetical protein n=1 Tax=Sporomusa aerivorans TaxID=204936 RepID=UPI00352AC00C